MTKKAKSAGGQTVKDNAEKSAHAAFEDLAQQIWDQHKIRVDSVIFQWFEALKYDGVCNVVQGASMDSESYRGER